MIMKALKYISAITLVALAATSCVIRFDKDKMLKALEDHKKFIEDYHVCGAFYGVGGGQCRGQQ